MELQDRGSGWVAHPAITDTCIQMGPMTGVVEALTAPPGSTTDSATRVVGGVAAFRAQAYPQRGLALAAAQRAPIAPDGSIHTHHWLMGGGDSRVLSISDLQVGPACGAEPVPTTIKPAMQRSVLRAGQAWRVIRASPRASLRPCDIAGCGLAG